MGNKITEVRRVPFRVLVSIKTRKKIRTRHRTRTGPCLFVFCFLLFRKSLEHALVSGGGIEIEIQRVAGQIYVHSVRSFNCD